MSKVVNQLSVAEINSMNNATLKSTLKDIVKTLEENEKAEQAKQPTASGGDDAGVPVLLQEILFETK